MDAELLEKARAVMQRVRVESSIETPMVIEEQEPVVSMWTILAEHDTDDVGKIMDVWRRLFGSSERREHIAAQLRELRRWQA